MRNDDCLIVMFDKDPKGIDETILFVSRREHDGMHINKQYKGEQAEKLYKALLGEIRI